MINSILTTKNKLITNHPLLILTDLETFQIKFLNPTVEKLLGYSFNNSKEKLPQFEKEYIHPEDCCTYTDFIKTLKNSSENEIREVELRLKSQEEGWKKYKFISRLYNYKFDGDNPMVISLAFPACTEKKIPEGQENDYLELKSEYQHLLESLDEAFCIFEMIFDKNGNPVDYLFIETNSAFEEQINLKDVVGKTMRELIPNHEEDWFKIYGKVARTGESIRFKFQGKKLDNAWLDLYAFKLAEPESNQVAVIFKNISEQVKLNEELKQAKTTLEKKATRREKELKESNDLLQTVFDTTNLGIAVFRIIYSKNGTIEDFEYLRINEVLRGMAADKEILGKRYGEITTYGVKMGIFDAFKKVAETGKPLDNEFYFDHEGYHNWFRVTAKKQDSLLVATLEDISKRKAEAQELKETIRFKRQLVRTSPETIMIINLNNFTVRYINKDISVEAGMTREKVEGKPLEEIIPFIHPRDREILIGLHKKLLKSTDDDIYDVEIRLKLGGNDWEWFSVRGKIFHRRDNDWVNEYVLLVRNIHQQKITQKALLKAEKLSIQGEIARTLAHELRNPLASIGMATEVLEKKLQDEKKENFSNYLNILSRSTKTLNNLITNLLNASNYSPAVLKRTDLAQIILKAIQKASDRIYLSGIQVIHNFQGPYFIMADEEKLEIAILNIIVNASEATKPEEGIIQLEIEKHNSDFLLSITDNGHGLKEEEIERLFEAFYTSKSTGVGVGLNSVKTILEDHDANIKVSSTPNVGTTFKLFFHNADIK